MSATQLTCTVPAASAGYAQVKVTNPDSQSATASNSYAYEASPTTNPPDINALEFWLRPEANSRLVVGQKIQHLTDASSNQFFMQFPTDSTRVTFNTSNGKNLFRFAGSKRIVVPTSINPTAYTIFLVAKNNGSHPSGDYGVPISLGADYTNTMRVNAEGTVLFGNWTTSESSFSSAWSNTSVPILWTVSVPTTGSNETVKIWRNATPLGTGSGTAALGGAWTNIVLGDFNTLEDLFFNGDIYEVVLYSSALSDAEIILIQNYLNSKYTLF